HHLPFLEVQLRAFPRHPATNHDGIESGHGTDRTQRMLQGFLTSGRHAYGYRQIAESSGTETAHRGRRRRRPTTAPDTEIPIGGCAYCTKDNQPTQKTRPT